MASASRTEQREMESIMEMLVVVSMAGSVLTSVSHYKHEQEHCYVLYEVKYEESCHQQIEQVRIGKQVGLLCMYKLVFISGLPYRV